VEKRNYRVETSNGMYQVAEYKYDSKNQWWKKTRNVVSNIKTNKQAVEICGAIENAIDDHIKDNS
jgi:hypothetical protein